MNSIRPKQVLERGAASDLWRHTLSQIPTVFGRLVYLSSLRERGNLKSAIRGWTLVGMPRFGLQC